MSLINDHKELIKAIQRSSNKASAQQMTYFKLIEGMVCLHQKYRLEENYPISDEIRSLLNSVGINIIQGTAKYKSYEEIPENMKNRQVNDTWDIMKKI